MDALSDRGRRVLPSRRRQQGFVLVVTLVILVIITLASVAMMATLRAGISASGNIAFRQAATRTADVAVDQAFQDTAANFTTAALATNPNGLDGNLATAAYRYYATVNAADVACTKDGSTTFQPQTYRFNDSSLNVVNDAGGIPCAVKLASSPSGYSLFYVVHRMAETAGACGTAATGCNRILVDGGNKPGCSTDASSIDYCGTSAYVYYRITVKVAGPRQNNRYIQTFVY